MKLESVQFRLHKASLEKEVLQVYDFQILVLHWCFYIGISSFSSSLGYHVWPWLVEGSVSFQVFFSVIALPCSFFL